MKRFIHYSISIAFILFVGQSYGQSTRWYKCYGNSGYDYARDVKEDNDTGYVVTGSSTSFGVDNSEAYLLKLNKMGEFQWSRNYGGPGSEWGESMVITNDSTYAIAGYTNSYGAGGFDFYLIRIDEDGEPLWEQYYGGADWDRAFGLIQLPDSGFVMAGETYSFEPGKQEGYIIRTDKNGDVIWEYVIDDVAPSFLKDIDLDGDSIVVCGGIGDGGYDTYDGYVAKFHIDGTFGWDKRIGEEHNDYFNAVCVEGGLYNLGGVNGYEYIDEGDNMWLYRMDDIGTEVIDTVYPTLSPRTDGINDVDVRDFDLDYYHTGYSVSWGYGEIDGEPDLFIGKLAMAGFQLGAQNYGHAGPDVGHAIHYCRDGGVVIAGDTKFFATGGNNIMVIKMNILWERFEGDEGDIFSFVEYDYITSSITSYAELNDVTVYPNPFNDVIQIPEIAQGMFSIYSADGKLVVQETKYSQLIDLSDLASGTYILVIESEGEIHRSRIVKK